MDSFAAILARTLDGPILDAVERLYEEGFREDYAEMLDKLRAVKPVVSKDELDERVQSIKDGTAELGEATDIVLGDAPDQKH